jgi:hypothetical protein
MAVQGINIDFQEVVMTRRDLLRGTWLWDVRPYPDQLPDPRAYNTNKLQSTSIVLNSCQSEELRTQICGGHHTAREVCNFPNHQERSIDAPCDVI